jgi:predicted amidophosphoribosyltransferase
MVAINPRQIRGVWRQGYVLDNHTVRSEFLGYNQFGNPMFDTKRTEAGELLYRLKYRQNLEALATLVETTTTFVRSWQVTFDAIVPVPPTRVRRFQPVFEIATRLAEALELPLLKDFVQNVGNTKELKNVFDYTERLRLLENVYRIRDQSLHSKAVLLFDDLYRSGATLTAVTRALYEQAQCSDVYVLALTRTRTVS